MKKILLFIALFALGYTASAQSLALTYEGNTLASNSTIMVILDPGVEVVTAYIGCINNNADTVSVKTKKIIQPGDTLAETSNYFCWGACFPPYIYISPNSIPIEPGATNNDFYADYEPRTIIGVSTITYVFFNADNPNDSASVTVQWNASPAGLGQDLLKQMKLSDAYPNPASTVARIDYSLPAGMENSHLVISNLLGAKVKEIPVSSLQGRIDIPVSDLPNGIYFYTLKTQNNLAITQKFVVRH